MTMPDPTPPTLEADPNSLPIDFQEMMDHATNIQGKVIADMTKDLAAQRAVSTSLQKKIAELTEQIQFQQEHITELEEKINPPSPPIEDLKQAELVLDKIVEEGAAKPSNGSKPPAKAVSSPS